MRTAPLSEEERRACRALVEAYLADDRPGGVMRVRDLMQAQECFALLKVRGAAIECAALLLAHLMLPIHSA